MDIVQCVKDHIQESTKALSQVDKLLFGDHQSVERDQWKLFCESMMNDPENIVHEWHHFAPCYFDAAKTHISNDDGDDRQDQNEFLCHLMTILSEFAFFRVLADNSSDSPFFNIIDIEDESGKHGRNILGTAVDMVGTSSKAKGWKKVLVKHANALIDQDPYYFDSDEDASPSKKQKM